MQQKKDANYSIKLKNKKVVKFDGNFDNQIVCRVLHAVFQNISPKVEMMNTQKVITDEKKKGLLKAGVQDVLLVSALNINKYIQDHNQYDLAKSVLLGTKNKAQQNCLDRLQNVMADDRNTKDKQKDLNLALDAVLQSMNDGERKIYDSIMKIKNTPKNNPNDKAITADYRNVETTIAKQIMDNNANSVSKIIEAMNTEGDTIKFTTAAGGGVGGHAYILHRDRKGTFHIISSITLLTAAIEEIKEENWFKCLQEKVGNVNFVIKNRQNFSQGCIFCMSYTEALLKQGTEVDKLPPEMPERIEKSMMDLTYLSLRPIYTGDDLKDPSEEFFSQGWYDDQIEITEAILLKNIEQNSQDGTHLINEVKNSPGANNSKNQYQQQQQKINYQEQKVDLNQNNKSQQNQKQQQQIQYQEQKYNNGDQDLFNSQFGQSIIQDEKPINETKSLIVGQKKGMNLQMNNNNLIEFQTMIKDNQKQKQKQNPDCNCQIF